MKRSLHARIAELEKTQQQAIRARDCSSEMASGSAIEKIREYLSDHGIEQEATESLAATFARAIGVSLGELKERLREAALG
jgi:protein subunit release factor A